MSFDLWFWAPVILFFGSFLGITTCLFWGYGRLLKSVAENDIWYDFRGVNRAMVIGGFFFVGLFGSLFWMAI